MRAGIGRQGADLQAFQQAPFQRARLQQVEAAIVLAGPAQVPLRGDAPPVRAPPSRRSSRASVIAIRSPSMCACCRRRETFRLREERSQQPRWNQDRPAASIAARRRRSSGIHTARLSCSNSRRCFRQEFDRLVRLAGQGQGFGQQAADRSESPPSCRSAAAARSPPAMCAARRPRRPVPPPPSRGI